MRNAEENGYRGFLSSIVFCASAAIKPCRSQEDEVSKAAIETVKRQIRLPAGTEIRFVEKKESQIPGFYTVKMVISSLDKDTPVVAYVDQSGEKVILGSLFVKGENVTVKEAGPPIAKKIDMAILDLDRSPSIGQKGARVTIAEFSNFQCPHCMDSWTKLKPLLERLQKRSDIFLSTFHLNPRARRLSFQKWLLRRRR